MRTNRDRRVLDKLADLAEDSPPCGKARLAAAIVLQNKIISYGFNSYKTDPFQKRFAKNDDAICKHAEVDAIKNALRRISVDDLCNATLYIARVKYDQFKRNRSFGLAKPCVGCQSAIDTFEIGRVVYTCEGTDYEAE